MVGSVSGMPAGVDGTDLVRTPGLRERDRFLRELGDCPPGHIVLVAGEAGVGKTSLVRAFCDGDERRSLWGGCDALTTPQPLGPVMDMARQTGGQLARAIVADNARHLLFSAFLDLLAGQPTVAVIEDAHWADEATLDLLMFLGRRIGQTTSLLVITYREEAVGPSHPLRAVLGVLAGQHQVRRIALPPLSQRTVADIAKAHGLDTGELFERTGGNPFFVAEVLANPGPAVPASVRDAVLARAAALSEPAAMALARSAEHWAQALARLERLGAQPAARRLALLGRRQGLRPHTARRCSIRMG